MTISRNALLRTPLGLLVGMCCCNLLSGCASMYSVPLNYTPDAYGKRAVSQPVSISVVDNRPYVLNGKESPYFVGHVRNGYGMPFGYTTPGKVALAKEMETDLARELAALGFAAGTPDARCKLNVAINDFNFDGFMGGNFWYDVKVTVRDASGTVLAEQTIKDRHDIRKSMRGAHYAIRAEVPGLYNQLVRRMVRENPAILRALKPAGK